MRIINTYEEIISLLNEMNGVFDIHLWEKYASRISNDFPQKLKHDSRNYDFNNDILPIINLVMSGFEKLKMANNSFIKSTDRLDERIKNAIGIELQVDIIFCLGLCNGAGWATKLNKNFVVLLGVEKIIELGWYDFEKLSALIYHELGHIWQDTVSGLQGEDGLTQLYREGVAMYFEQLMAGDFNYYHQNKNGWLDWCHANKNTLNTEYLRRLKTGENTQEFFGDWLNYQGYSDVGYYIGCEFIKWLSERYPINELAKLDRDMVYQEFENFVG